MSACFVNRHFLSAGSVFLMKSKEKKTGEGNKGGYCSYENTLSALLIVLPGL